MSFHLTFNLWLEQYTGQTVIAAYQGQDRPGLPYLMTNVTDRVILSQTPRTTIARDDEAGEPEIEVVQDIEYRISVHAYGGDPMAALAPVAAAKHQVQAAWPLLPYKLHEIGRASFVPEVVQNKWEPRAVLRLTCHGVERDTRPGDVAETFTGINTEAR